MFKITRACLTPRATAISCAAVAFVGFVFGMIFSIAQIMAKGSEKSLILPTIMGLGVSGLYAFVVVCCMFAALYADKRHCMEWALVSLVLVAVTYTVCFFTNFKPVFIAGETRSGGEMAIWLCLHTVLVCYAFYECWGLASLKSRDWETKQDNAYSPVSTEEEGAETKPRTFSRSVSQRSTAVTVRDRKEEEEEKEDDEESRHSQVSSMS